MRICLAAFLLLLAACGAPGHHVPIDVPAAQPPAETTLVARDVGWLLTSDPHRSRAAMERLTRLDAEGVEALQAHAARIPSERDPRWLHVLDENHVLPALETEEELEFLLWKVDQKEAFYVMKAQSRLLDLAATSPEALVKRLEQGGDGTEALAVALAMRGEAQSVPVLLARYRAAETTVQRRVAAEALGHVVGEDLRPRTQGAPEELEQDAQQIERWIQQQGATRDG